jgi:hypothetical protein
MPKRRLEPDNIVDDKLSIVLRDIETLLKPYPHSIQATVMRVNGAPTEIALVAKIKVTGA